ncbi:MAG: hypothetical protein LBI94_02595, partial [Treponema sp.]|nr:hypothetical protein [Treponema sp.]
EKYFRTHNLLNTIFYYICQCSDRGRQQFQIQKSKFEKSRKKFSWGPVGWKNPGPPPQILSTFRFRETGPRPAFAGRLFISS